MAAKAKKIISINLVDSHPAQARIGAYLRSQRDLNGAEIKDLVLAALGSYFDPLAIGNDPASSPQQIETALIDSIFALTDRRNRLIAHCESKYGVRLSADCKLLLGLGNSNLQAPTDEIGSVQKNSRQVIAIAPVISADEDEAEDDDDPYAGMSDEEFFAATAHLVTHTNVV